MTILAIAMLGVGLACAGEKATPTPPPTATPAPTATTAPTATATLVPGAPTPTATAVPTATATAVPTPTVDVASLPWIERYMRSPGYKPEWGQPKRGGTFKFGANRDRTAMWWFGNGAGGCYQHGCAGQPILNRLVRLDPWIGTLDTLEGDLAKSFEMSGDGLTLTFQLREGVRFQENPKVPAEYKGGKITGDEFVCEDAKASVEIQAWPPKWETSRGDEPLYQHLDSVTCPDGPRGYTLVMNFKYALARTMNTLAATPGMVMADKDWIAWVSDMSAEKGRPLLEVEVPQNFTWLHGTGPFIPVEFTPGVGTKAVRNPDYFREGLPLVDAFQNFLLMDQVLRFTALATGKIHYYGEGSFSLTPGQVVQAVRDFPDKIIVSPQLNMWASSGNFSTIKPPFNDVRVRKAVHLALDREVWQAMRKSGLFEGAPLAYVMPPRTVWAASQEEMRSKWPGLRQPKDQDIAEANRLLDEVFGPGNRPSGVKCTAIATDQISVDGCLFVMDQLKKHLKWIVASDFLESAVVTAKREVGGHDFNIWSDVSTVFMDPDDFFPSRYDREFASLTNKVLLQGLWAEMPQVMEEVESMVRAQGVELDPAKRQRMVRDLEWKLMTEVYGHLTIAWRNMFGGWTKDLKGWVGYDYHSNTKWPMFERVWLAR